MEFDSRAAVYDYLIRAPRIPPQQDAGLSLKHILIVSYDRNNVDWGAGLTGD